MSTEKRETHLRLLRAVTRRMFAGSLLLKGWAVVLVAGLLALASNPLYTRWAWLALFLAIAFWMLDANLLRQQRLYQKAYERARMVRDESVDFSLDTSAVQSQTEAWSSLMFSRRLGPFYAGVVGSIAFIRLVLL